MKMSKREIDSYSYQLGIIDCFNEMVNAGVKRIAMSHPRRTAEERDQYLEACREICSQYGTMMYAEDDSFHRFAPGSDDAGGQTLYFL